MTVLNSLNQLRAPKQNTVLTIGNFDGVHRGHLTLFDKVKERAKAINGQSVVMTFDPHPIKIMKSGNGPLLITPTQQKLKLIENAGIDIVLCLPFTKEFAEISPEVFVKELLVDTLGIKEIVVGYDYSFGKDRTGNIELLEHLGKTYGFPVHVVDQIFLDGIPISSTNVRKLVEDGELARAKKLLGRDYQVRGTVVTGKNRGGRLLGFPTANLELVDELTPKPGVYAVHVIVDEQIYNGMTNIGYNPTFGNNAFSVETHILNFSENLVGKTIKVNFIERLRNETTFKSIEELAEQIRKDEIKAREIFKNR